MDAHACITASRSFYYTPLIKKIVSCILLSLVTLTALVSTSFSLDPKQAITQYNHSVWLQEDGLPQNLAMCITQTRDGYLWLGTQDGIVRFDGIRFTIFNRNNTKHGINNNSILSLIETTDGSLWAGTENGLTRMQNGKFVTYTKAD